MPAQVDFAAEIQHDFRRQYGAGSVLPTCIINSIEYNKTHDSETIIRKSQTIAKRLLAIHSRLQDAEAAEHATFKPHLQKLYKNKSFLFMEELTREAVDACPELADRKDQVLSLFRKLKEGLPTRGEISPSGFWRLLPAEGVEDAKAEAVVAARKPDRKPPQSHWATDADVEEMNRQTEKMLTTGAWTEIPRSDWQPREAAATVFPVHQHNKVRMCCDLRSNNLTLFNYEKMRLLGVRATIEVIGRCMSPFKNQPALRAYKSDLKEDFEAERRLRAASVAAAEEQVLADVEADFRFASSTILPEGERGEVVGGQANGDRYGFLPFGGKKDMSAYYYQYGIDNPVRNRLWVPGSKTGKRTRDGAAIRNWRLIQSAVALFGSLSSIYDCVHGSEVIQLIVNQILQVICTLYIDDLHSHSRKLCLESDNEVVGLFLNLSGFDESIEKRELHSLIQKAIVVLGIQYAVDFKLETMTLSIDPSRVERLHVMGRDLVQQFKINNVQFDLVSSFRGLMRHVCQLSIQFNHIIRGLDPWCDESFFSDHIKSHSERRQLLALIRLLLGCIKFTQKLEMNSSMFELSTAHVYSDASLEDLAGVNKALKAGRRSDLGRYGMWIGGFVARPDGSSRAFSIHVTRVPPHVDRLHIGILESLAARTALHIFQDDAKRYFTVYHIDNSGAVFALSKNASSCTISQSIGASFIEFCIKRGLRYWICWISSGRNVSDVLTRMERQDLLKRYFPDCEASVLDISSACRSFLWTSSINQP